jgi:hypothetical protein
MAMKKLLTTLGFTILLSAGSNVLADEYCTLPYLNATNIRTACEEYGVHGLQGLYSSSLHIQKLLKIQAKITQANITAAP